jgi:hypothetical protein
MMQRCVVKYQYADYSGKVTVYADEDDDTEVVIAKAWKKLRPYMTLGMASTSAKVIVREDVDDDAD